MGTDLLERPDSDQDEERKGPLFDGEASRGVYDDTFKRSQEQLRTDKTPSFSASGDQHSSNPNKKLSSSAIESAESSSGGITDHVGSKEKSELSTSVSNNGAGSWITRLGNKKNKMSKGKRTAMLVGIAGGSGGLIIMGGVLIIALASLKIPHLGENIATWQFARTSRAMRRNTSNILGEKTWIDTMQDDAFTAAKDKYGKFRGATWGKMDKFRPKKVLANMEATGVLDYKYSEPEGLLKRRKLTHVVVDGHEIPVAEKSWRKPIQNKRNIARFNGELDAHLEEALQDHRSLIRNKVANRLREKIGLKKLSFPKNKGRDYKKAKSKAEADIELLREAHEEVAEGTRTSGANDDINNATDEVAEELDNQLADDESAATMANKGEVTHTVTESIENAVDNPAKNAAKQAVGVASTVYAIAEPVCMIYEGSVENSGPLVDSQEKAVQKEYYMVASNGAQQKAGDVTAEAQGAMNRKLSHVADSVAAKRAGGMTGKNLVSTQQSAQASAAGQFNILNALFGNNSFIDSIAGAADKICPTVTNVWVGAGLGVVELAVAAVTCVGTVGTGCAGEAAAKSGAEVTVGQFLKHMATEVLSKQTLKRIIGEAAVVATGTLIAKLIVQSRANLQYSGVNKDEELADQADMGGNIHANEMNRQEFYGRPMTDTEIAYDMGETRVQLAQREQFKSPFERYFAISNPTSLISRLGLMMPTSLADAATGIASHNISPVSNLETSFGRVASFLSPSIVHAEDTTTATAQNYQIVQWGWSGEETKLMEDDDSYYALENERILEESGAQDKIEAEYKECFESSMGTLLAEKKILRKDAGEINNVSSAKCSPVNLGPHNPGNPGAGIPSGDMVFRWRLSKMYANTMSNLSELQNPEAENTSSSGSGGAATLDPNLPSGSKDELIEKIKASGKVKAGVDKLSTDMKQTTLAVILKLTEKYSFSIWSTIRPGGPPHGNGSAVDLGLINGGGPSGQDYAAVTEDMKNFAADAATILPAGSWMGVPNDTIKGICLPILTAKAGATCDLDTPATTGATGAHFHLNSNRDAP